MQSTSLISWFFRAKDVTPLVFQSFQRPWVPISNNICKSNIRRVLYTTNFIVFLHTQHSTSIMCGITKILIALGLWKMAFLFIILNKGTTYPFILHSIGISEKMLDQDKMIDNGRFRRELTLPQCRKIQQDFIFWRKAFICLAMPVAAIVLLITVFAIIRCMTRNRINQQD